MSVDEVLEYPRESLAEASMASGSDHAQPPAEPSPRELAIRFFREFAGNLQAGLRVALLRPASSDRFHVSPHHLVALVLFDLALTLIRGFARSGPTGALDLDALPGHLFPVTILLFGGYLIALLQGHRVGPLALPVIVLSATPITYGVSVLCDLGMGRLPAAGGPSARFGYVFLFTAWIILMDLIAVRSVVGRWSVRTLRDAVVFVVVAFLPLFFLPPGELWVGRPDAEPASPEERYPSVVREDVLHRQPELLRRALAGLKPQRPGVADLYFVGFGSYAHQDVFMKEIESIRALFDDRFDTRGRSVALINNPQTVGHLPIATASNLDETLQQIGRLMDREEDLLFLYLTSHGSERRELSVTFWPLDLKQIDPTLLQELLHRARIKWRIVVISACYSGGFIDRLKDDHTFIATAAAADRQSFGCGHEFDFTYFGRAYFDDALRHSYSFLEAFESAKAAIAQREGAEQKTPSNPQMYVGPALRPRLEHLARRLAEASTGRNGSR